LKIWLSASNIYFVSVLENTFSADSLLNKGFCDSLKEGFDDRLNGVAFIPEVSLCCYVKIPAALLSQCHIVSVCFRWSVV